MCILSFIPGGTKAEIDDLFNGGVANPHGSGWAIATPKGIEMDKSMKVEEAIITFEKAHKKWPECPALFHSRWATHGTSGIANVHPFLVGGSHDTVVAHNGILPCTPKKDDWRSDTRILADEFIGEKGKYRRFDKPTAKVALEKYIGTGNKLVVLTVDPKYKKDHYIFNENIGHWDKATGVWHSNYSYLDTPKSYGKGYYGGYGRTYYSRNANGTYVPTTYVTKKGTEYCDFCGYGLIGKAGYCIECGTCDTCSEFRKECECHSHYYRKFDWDQKTIGRKAIAATAGKQSCDKALETIAEFTTDEAQSQLKNEGLDKKAS